MEVNFFDNVDESLVKIVVIISKYKGKLVFGRHKLRDTFEFPAGHREVGESALEAAKRELMEETSATDYTIEPLCAYSVIDELGENFGMIYLADIKELSLNLEYEIEEIIFSESVPENMTYPYAAKMIIDEAKRRGVLFFGS